jgi:hypothetical protein
MKPLSAKRRTFSVLALLIVFLLGTPFLLAYSTGYRFSFEQFSFVKTGGIFIHADLAGTRVFIDDEFIESNGSILRNTLVQNLESDRLYRVRIEKDNYLPWYKDLYVYPNLVTEGRIMMLPIEIPFERIAPTLEEQVTGTSTKPTKQTKTGIPNPAYVAAIDLFATTTVKDAAPTALEQSIDKLVASTTIESLLPDYMQALNIPDLESKEELQEQWRMVAWLEGGNLHLTWAGTKDATPFFFCDVRGCRDRIIVSLDTDIEHFAFYPGRNDVFVVETMDHIFAVEADDRSKPNVQTIYEGEQPTFRLLGNTIYVVDGEALYTAEI